jgi:hypothetical protein
MTGAPFETFCSTLSRASGEPLFGTATQAEVWFLLEYDAVWERKAFESSTLPPAIKERLAAQVSAIPQARVQVIRQSPRRAPEGIAFFVALTSERDPALYEFRLAAYADLLVLDLPAIVRRDPAYTAHRRGDPLWLVCTHGKRDRCCALYGLPVYRTLAAQVGAAVWQTSHVGGHRFAANLISFPYGIGYGRGAPDDVPGLVAAGQQGRLVIEQYRGRACYNKPAQAAEYYLRRATGQAALEAFRLIETSRPAPDAWAIRFEEMATGAVHDLALVEEPLPSQRVSCDADEPEALTQFRLIRHSTSGPHSA